MNRTEILRHPIRALRQADAQTRFEYLVVLLAGLWIFLIPFGKGEQVPGGFLALLGAYELVRTRGACLKNPAASAWGLLLLFYLVPVLVSIPGAVSARAPLRVFASGISSGLAGVAIISAMQSNRDLGRRILAVLAAVVAFWFVDAGIQAVFGRDILGLTWEEGRLSGPFVKRTQMGYYSGPFSALLLVYALQKNWRPVLRWLLFAYLSLIVLLNNSRGGWVMYAVVAAVWGWQALIRPLKHRMLVCTTLVALGMALVGGLYAGSASFRERANQTGMALRGDRQSLNRALTDRMPIWHASVSAFMDRPLRGFGARNFRLIAPDYWPDIYDSKLTNAYYEHQVVLEYAVGTGVVGLVGLAASFFFCFRWWFLAGPTQRRNAAGFALTLLALYFPLNTHKGYFGSEMAVSLWMVIALYVAAIRSPEDRGIAGVDS